MGCMVGDIHTLAARASAQALACSAGGVAEIPLIPSIDPDCPLVCANARKAMHPAAMADAPKASLVRISRLVINHPDRSEFDAP